MAIPQKGTTLDLFFKTEDIGAATSATGGCRARKVFLPAQPRNPSYRRKQQYLTILQSTNPKRSRHDVIRWPERIPVRRIGRAEEIAEAVLFLMSNGFVNGITLTVDGGALLT